MLPKDAIRELKDMGCLDFHPQTKFFKVARPPKRTSSKSKNEREWTLFITCVKTLGAYSVGLRGERAPVTVERGNLPDEIIFRNEEESK